MNDELKTNLEILSKIVIQLKTEQKEIVKNLKFEIDELKKSNLLLSQKSMENSEFQIQNLKDEIIELKKSLKEKEEKHCSDLNDYQLKLEKTDRELREDMFKLLRKYESKFQIQDDEIESLKEKCEMGKCGICDFESFKVHFKDCPVCEESVCLSCLKNCKKCDLLKCGKCLCQCNGCLELFCIISDADISNAEIKINNFEERDKSSLSNGNLMINNYNKSSSICILKCKLCLGNFCQKCNFTCNLCKESFCNKCLQDCRICKNYVCKSCCQNCQKCFKPIVCNSCFPTNSENEKCICGKILCFECEDDCSECNIPFKWLDENRIFQGFHIRSKDFLPTKCFIKLLVLNKGIDTTHIGLTVDTDFSKNEEKATENFWSFCLNTGEKFSTVEYKKKGMPWTNYATPVKTGDIIYLKFYEGEVRYLINRKDYGRAFLLDSKNHKYYLYCLTHNDSTKIEIRNMKIFSNNLNRLMDEKLYFFLK